MSENFTKYFWKKDGQLIVAFVDEGIDEDGNEFQTYYKILECHCRPGDESKFVMDAIMSLPKIKSLLGRLKRSVDKQATARILVEKCKVKKPCRQCEGIMNCVLYCELKEVGKYIALINKQLSAFAD